MTQTKQDSIRSLERMLAREKSRLARIIISLLLIAMGLAYFVVTSYVFRDWSPAAVSEMYGDVRLCLFTPLVLYFKGLLFVGAGVFLLIRTLDRSREVMLTALLEVLRSNCKP